MAGRIDPLNFSSLCFSWIAAAAAAFAAVLATVIGQGLGAVGGGCRWIGITLAVDHQPWALLNLPDLGFSGRPAALGYWFGGVGLCLLIGLLAVPLLPRPRKLGWELMVLQLAWMSLSIGVCWLPLLDAWDGHISRFLRLHEFSPAWVWIFPILGSWVALIPVLRLLALLRDGEPTASAFKRSLCVMAHFGVPTLGWMSFGLALELPLLQAAASTDSMPGLEILLREFWAPLIGALLPVVAALLFAVRAYPRPFAFPMAPLSGGQFLAVFLALAAGGGLFFLTGAPVGNGMSRGLLWGRPDSRSNIRSWVRPVRLVAGDRSMKSDSGR